MSNVLGTDVSFYQDDPNTPRGIDFEKMKAAGAKFVIIRAGQNLWEDNEFEISWKASKGVLPRGSYWFYDSRIDPKMQAKKWLSCFDDARDIGELSLWCDFEDRYGGAFGTWKHWYNFMEELKVLRPGVKLGIYTGYYYWRENTIAKAIPTASLNYFKQYPLWIANYGTNVPLVPEPWDTWTLWQFTDNGDGRKYGVESLNIDLNYFNGDEDEFRARFQIGKIDEEALPVSAMYGKTVISYKEI
jgi:lysozyme